MNGDEAAPEPRIEVRRGNPTDDELAALIAVTSDAYRQESHQAVAGEDPRPSVWQQQQRRLRRPLRRDIPWGRFHG